MNEVLLGSINSTPLPYTSAYTELMNEVLLGSKPLPIHLPIDEGAPLYMFYI